MPNIASQKPNGWERQQIVELQQHELQPSKATIEKTDVKNVAGEFRQFLERTVYDGDKPQSAIFEIR